MKHLRPRGFTLIELLIVVAIIAILAAIAVPNFLEAQTRAKVSRVKADMRTLVTGLQAYRVDFNEYPEGTDTPTKYPQQFVDFFGPLASGYYTFATRTPAGGVAGRDFFTLTTPIAYVSVPLEDPFTSQKGTVVYYQYRNAKDRKNGFIITSVGPDNDLMAPDGVGSQNAGNPMSTLADSRRPSRLGDINERAVIHYLEDSQPGLVQQVNAQYGSLRNALEDLSYDPTNGTVSEGDIYRLEP